jgi:hypothetical protein
MARRPAPEFSVSNIPTYAFAALQLSVALVTVLSAQSAARYEQEQARRGPSVVGLRLPGIAPGESPGPTCAGCGFVAPLP